jgi:hypothetical protein
MFNLSALEDPPKRSSGKQDVVWFGVKINLFLLTLIISNFRLQCIMHSTTIPIENISPRVIKRKYDKLYELLENSLSRHDVKSGVLDTKLLEGRKFDVLVRFIYPKQDNNEHAKDYNDKTEKIVVKYGPKPTESQAIVALRYNSKTSELKVNLSLGEKCKFPNDIMNTINEIANARDWTLLNSISVAPKKENLISKLVEFSNRYNSN